MMSWFDWCHVAMLHAAVVFGMQYVSVVNLNVKDSFNDTNITI